MRVLIIGFSNITQRRVAPALRGLQGIDAIDVATRQAATGQLEWRHGNVYDDYARALEESGAELVYISLVNSEHGRWAEAALRRGLHTVVDKPAFLGLREAERMLELADQQGVCLAEATVFSYHPQMELIRQQFRAAGDTPKRVNATLSFPPFEASNFRWRRALGGGALWDLGPYAAATGRVFFGEEPRTVACRVLDHGGPDKVDTAFSVLATFTDGRAVVGNFGFDTVYRNRVDVLGAVIGAEMERFFTTLPGAVNELRVTTRDGVATLSGPEGDGFAAFFEHTLRSIAVGDWQQLSSDLRADARTLSRLRQAAGET